MKYVFLTLSLFVLSASILYAQTADNINPYNLTELMERIGELGIPDPAGIDELGEVARSAYDAGDCVNAIPALETYGRMADWYADLILSGVAPYNRALPADQRRFGATRPLIAIERRANEFIRMRNEAMLMHAECLVQTGEIEKAAAMYYQALQVIYLNETELWEKARNGLYSIIEFEF
jgi:hypothetical protein